MKIGGEAINIFCGLMDLGQGISKKAYEQVVAPKTVFDILSVKAVNEIKAENEARERPLFNLKVSGVGS